MGIRNRLLKQGFVLINAFLLAFEPTAMAVGKAEQNDMKVFLEESGITRKEVSLAEFYQKVSPHLPAEVKEQFEEMVKENPGAMLPKFNVSTIKGANGEDDIQLQFVKEKKAGVLTIVGRGQTFAKIGGSTLTYEDVMQSDRMFAKLNQEFPDPNPKRKVASEGLAFRILSTKDFQRLEKGEQKSYMKNLRDIMQATESLQNSQVPTSKDHSSLLFDLIFPEAQAGSKGDPSWEENSAAAKVLRVGEPCIYAGHLADYGCKNSAVKLGGKCPPSNGFTCGGQGSKFNEKMNSSLKCDGGILCNPDIYGEGVCVSRAVDATAKCNEKTSKYDAFDGKKYFGTKDWEAEKEKIQAEVTKQRAFCRELKSDKKALADQKETCSQLESRVQEIMKAACPFGDGSAAAQKDFKYEKKSRFEGSYCKKEGSDPGPGPGPGGPSCPPDQTHHDGQCVPCKQGGGSMDDHGHCIPPSPVPPNGKCDPKDWYKAGEEPPGKCTETNGSVEPCKDKDGGDFWRCNCKNPPGFGSKPGVTASCRTDGSGNGTGGQGNSHYKPKPISFWAKNKSWIMPTVVGAAFLGLMYWGMKSALRSQYDFLNPKPTATPVPSGTATPRVRTTQ